MTDPTIDPKLDEILSAFLDGEVNARETHAVLDRLARNPRLHAVLDHHQRLRAQLRGELRHGLGDDFLNGIMTGIEADDGLTTKVVALKPRRSLPPFMRATLGLAMAASVAAVAVLTLQTLLPVTDPAFPLTTASVTGDVQRSADDAVKVAAVPEADGQHWHDMSSDAAAELNNYFISHNNSAIDHGLNGTIGFMRVAADDGIGLHELDR